MVNPTSLGSLTKFFRPCHGRCSPLSSLTFVCLCVSVFVVPSLALAQSQSLPVTQQADPILPGTISGQIADKSAAPTVGAHINPTLDGQSATQEGAEVVADSNGQFTFPNIPPGAFQLTISSPGFATQTISGVLHPGGNDVIPVVELQLA